MAIKEMEKIIETEIENKENIINKQVNIYPSEEYLEVEIIYEVLEKIGKKEKI